MSLLPLDWELLPLTDVCLRATKFDPFAIGRLTIRYVDIGSIDGSRHALSDVPTLLAASAPTRARQIVRTGDTVFSTVRPYLEKIAYVGADLDEEFASTGFCVLRPGPRLDPRWLFHFSTSRLLLEQVLPHQRGVSYPAVRDKDVLSAMIPLPDMTVQRRIVEVLEEHLSRLDAAKELVHLGMLRARSLVVSAIEEALGVAGGEPMTINQLAQSVRNGIFVSRPKVNGEGVAILRIGAVRSLALELTDLRYSERTEEELRAEGALLSSGDLLFTRYNGNPRYVGACAVVPDLRHPLTYPDKLIRVVLDRKLANPEFVALACSAGAGRAQIHNAVKTTAGQAGISGRDLKAVCIRVPEVGIQDEIVGTVRKQLDAVRSLQGSLSDGVRRATGLRRALLHAAFSGRLAIKDSGAVAS